MPADPVDSSLNPRAFASANNSAWPGDSAFETQTLEQALGTRLESSRWIGWRLRLLVGAALLGCIGIFVLIRALADWSHIDAVWRANERGQIELASSSEPALRGLQGRVLV